MEKEVLIQQEKYELKQVRCRVYLSEEMPFYSTSRIGSPLDAIHVMQRVLEGLDREFLAVVNLDNKNRPINYNIVGIGTNDHCEFYLPNIFKAALLSNSSRIMVFHNHLSSDLEPSICDCQITERMAAASYLIGIPILDHVIVGDDRGRYFSFRDSRPELLEKTWKDPADAIRVMKTTEEKKSVNRKKR